MTLDDKPLAGRVAVVTGAAHGIGEGIARELAARGAMTVIADVDGDRAAAVARSLTGAGAQALALASDVSAVGDVQRMMDTTVDTFGPVDILVNNAAIFHHDTFVDHPVEAWDRLFAVNVRGVFLCCKAVLPSMIERRKGAIINIASISAKIWTTHHTAYSSSKAAVVTMTRDIAAEVAEFDVRVNVVAPGPIDSNHQWDKPRAGVLMSFVGVPHDIATAVAFLASDEARFITGETLTVAGGSDLKVAR